MALERYSSLHRDQKQFSIIPLYGGVKNGLSQTGWKKTWKELGLKRKDECMNMVAAYSNINCS